MYELIKINENDYYFDCPAKIGLVKISEDEVILIDAGGDKDAGKKVLKTLDEKGWKLAAIYNTHSHADHIGGNKLLQDRTGCTIYGSGLEKVFTENPILEPMCLYGGSPYKDLRHKFLLAEKTVVTKTPDDGLLGGITVIPFPGHSFDMVGYLTKNGTAYIGDVVSSEETLKKYGIGYLYSPTLSRASLESLKTLKADFFVPAHAGATADITYLADYNINAISMVRETILGLLCEGKSFETLLGDIFREYNLTMNAIQHELIGSTLRSYLSDLYEHGLVTFEFCDNVMVWKKV